MPDAPDALPPQPARPRLPVTPALPEEDRKFISSAPVNQKKVSNPFALGEEDYSLNPRARQKRKPRKLELVAVDSYGGIVFRFKVKEGKNTVGNYDPINNTFPDIDFSPIDPDRVISRKHAELLIDTERGKFSVRDLKSRNGSFVRNLRIHNTFVDIDLEEDMIFSNFRCRLLPME
jgi:pSer/pThr/pTyr-binding forkhead associated (FHA) protein